MDGIQALLEVVDSGVKNMEICVVRQGAGGKVIMEEKDVDALEAEEGKTKSMMPVHPWYQSLLLFLTA